MPNTNAHLDDIREGFTETANNGDSPHLHFGFHDTTENENVPVHERLVPPLSASYSINFGEVAPTPVDMCLAVGELFESKRQLQSQLGRYAFANRFQIKVMKSDPTRYQVRCIVEEYKWRLRAVKVANSVYFQIRRFDHEHTCSNESRFPHERQARPVIAIDVTFLKGPHTGVLFVAVCMDGNDQIFPLAFGVGDSETNEAWEWFLTRLHRAVGEVDDLVIVSDRKNSIITGVEKVFPKSFHGTCAVHLNGICLGAMGRISPRKRYNLTSSNIAEAMNNAIKVCRELPITGVIDCIRGVLQRWFYNRRTSAGKLKSTLTTKADVSIGVKARKARYLTVYPITYYSFLVKDGDLDGTVDLTSKTCTCREFDMDGHPCEHALACIRVRRFSYIDYCSPYYSSAFLTAAYSGEIHPVGHPPEWLVPEDIASIVVLLPMG
ncbi:hypothetical protein Ddye_025606 [Dipteronia dyeriana]|uniref:SWIM-type domain-containing protein n=1 Tax=Dipteronia dyeriana TaxID=168575 RepID=A0AAD9TKP3_9ROSI|nr:hypothetical protein Ddye_025606 [Dipteronia dyeriana]